MTHHVNSTDRPSFIQKTASAQWPVRRQAASLSHRAADVLDRGVEAFLHIAKHLPSLGWMAPVMAPGASQSGVQVKRDMVPLAARLISGVLSQQPAATAAFDQIVGDAVDSVRRTMPPGWRGWVHQFDHWFYRDIPELEDDPNFPLEERKAIIRTIHRFNDHAGSYERFIACLAPLIERAEREGQAPVRIVDIAAGAGGLALGLKERFGDRVEVTATDIADDFLSLGRQAAQERGLQVRFIAQDATNLQNLRPHGVDIVICTQALHHFQPGMAARMLGQASQVARSAVCFIDGEREPVYAALLGTIMGLYGRTWPAIYDTVASVRRMYTREELDVVTSFVPGMPQGWGAQVSRLAPGHLTVVLSSQRKFSQESAL